MDKQELASLVSTPLDPDLDYYDATKAIEVMADHIRGLHRLIEYMFQSLGIQGAAIIDLRKKMVEHAGAIELLSNIVAPEDVSGRLVGLEPPQLIGITPPSGRKPS